MPGLVSIQGTSVGLPVPAHDTLFLKYSENASWICQTMCLVWSEVNCQDKDCVCQFYCAFYWQLFLHLSPNFVTISRNVKLYFAHKSIYPVKIDKNSNTPILAVDAHQRLTEDLLLSSIPSSPPCLAALLLSPHTSDPPSNTGGNTQWQLVTREERQNTNHDTNMGHVVIND